MNIFLVFILIVFMISIILFALSVYDLIQFLNSFK